MATRVVTAHIPSELAKKVDQLSARLDRPRGWIIKEALVALIATEEARHELTLEALRDVDAGHVIDHAQVVASLKKVT